MFLTSFAAFVIDYYIIKMKTIKFVFNLFIMTIFPFISTASVEIEGSLKQIHKGVVGEVYKGEIKIYNSDKFDQDVKIYQADLMYNYKGATFYDEPVSHNRSNASWMKFSPRTIRLKGGESQYIRYEITIPKSDTVIGTYWSILMVEGVNPIDPNQAGKMNITTLTRYAVQMITELPDPGKGKLEFMEPSLIQEGKKSSLAVDISNLGNHYILPEVSMELFDEKGTSVKVIKASKKGLFPGTSSRYVFDLAGVDSGKKYKAIIVAAGSNEDVFGLEYSLFF